MKKTLIMLIAALMCAFTAVADEEDTELLCDVDINFEKVQDATSEGAKEIFNELKQVINEFMNMTKWTNATFATNEKINCSMLLTLSKWDNNTGIMEGDLQIQSQRPVYNSSYTTAVINFKDNKINFEYQIGKKMEYSEYDMDNLSAIFSYWAYMIIGMDFDTFELKGGTPYYEQADKIVRMMQSRGESGWKAFEDNTNRSAVLSAFTETKTEPIRQMLYDYHRMGLDQMVVSVDKGRSAITHTLENLAKIYDLAPLSVCLSMFKDAKLQELVNVYSKANMTEKQSVYEMLYQIYPSETQLLEQIKQEPSRL